MAKIILTSRYTRAGKSNATRKNYINYIGSRENVEKIDVYDSIDATDKQSEFIEQLLNEYKDGKELLEYEDYKNNPSVKNASELIEVLLERASEVSDDREKYIKYIAERPRVDKIATHGLFSNDGVVKNLGIRAREISEHKGIVWSHVLSLRREEAESLGYDNYKAFKNLIDENIVDIAKAHKIKIGNLKYVGAFHNESFHPHLHLVIYSTDIKEGYLTEQGIENMRSKFANSIFKDEMYYNFTEQNRLRDELRGLTKEEVNEYLKKIQNNDEVSEKSLLLIKELHERLKNHKGTKTYKWFSKAGNQEIKNLIDELTKEVSSNENVNRLYDDWYVAKENNLRIYKNTMPQRVALYENENFSTIQNHIIREVLNLEFSQVVVVAFCEDEEQEDNSIVQEDMIIDEVYEEDYENSIFDSDIQGYDEQGVKIEEDHQTDEDSTQESLFVSWSERYKEAKNFLYLRNENNSNIELAYDLLKSEADRGNVLAIYDVALLNKSGVVTDEEVDIEKYFKNALIGFKNMSERESKMQSYFVYRVGKMYEKGLGTQQDDEKAFNWFMESANKNNEYAQYSVGNCYYYGKGVEVNYEEAFEYYKLATKNKKGNAFASFKVGEMSGAGIGTEINEEESQKHYRKALSVFRQMANRDTDGSMCLKIGKMYERGLGTESDLIKAKEFYMKAVKLDNDMARYRLSKVYLSKDYQELYNSEDLESDVKYAVETLKTLAEKDMDIKEHIYYALGKAYLFNETLGRDFELSKDYLTKSAELGNEYAQKLLNDMNERFYSHCYNNILGAIGRLIAKSKNHEDAKYEQSQKGRGIDRKVMSKIAEKKKEQGIRF